MKQIKNEHGVILRDLDMIIGRWKGSFDKLLNEENPRHRRTRRGVRGAVDPPIRADTLHLFGQKTTQLFD